ncbi:PRC-barrel domain-containing protein [Clostridioides difficile]|uniref:PRC-barrel domain-containing protein n=1 Tax=Clostridioides difficile TaxID=1496 RepID=UPI000B12F00F
MIRVSDIMEKEIINVKNGKRMGFIIDIDMDIHEGKVVSFTILEMEVEVFFQEEGMKKLYFGMIYLK